MITIVGFSPSIDKTAKITEFSYGNLNRIEILNRDLGGKAVNVANVLNNLNQDIFYIGFDYKKSGNPLKNALISKNIAFDLVNIDAEIRTNLKLYDHQKNFTEINEIGSNISNQYIELLFEKIIQSAKKSAFLILTGSLPNGVPSNIYEMIIRELNKSNVKIILDADSDALKFGITAKPFMIKPNKTELERLLNKKIKNHDMLIESLNFLAETTGLECICVSLGKDGAVLLKNKNIYIADSIRCDVKRLAGAGDAMVAGICYALVNNFEDSEILNFGIKSATKFISYSS